MLCYKNKARIEYFCGNDVNYGLENMEGKNGGFKRRKKNAPPPAGAGKGDAWVRKSS